MTVLITGGLGYIGSHIAVVLLENDYDIVIVDNLCNSKMEIYDNIKKITNKDFQFYELDILSEKMDDIFKNYNFDMVIHLASLKSVPESISQPIKYYNNNVNGLINILELMKKYNCKKILFSSSATVYGSKAKSPIKETNTVGKDITNPYGETKYIDELLLKEFSENNLVIIFRYFNPIGCHKSGLIGEDPCKTPGNIFPYLLRVVQGIYPKITIYGGDYPTRDGTCVRDYIHVMDIADAHLVAIKNLKNGLHIYNLGTGHGTTVLELLYQFQKVNGIYFNWEYGPRRNGDVSESYADASNFMNDFCWIPKYSLEDMCRDGYNYIANKTV